MAHVPFHPCPDTTGNSMKINTERLAATFVSLCEIDSPSRQEKSLSDYLKNIFVELGADKIITDNSAAKTGSDTGNLVIKFSHPGLDLEPIFFNCHLDVISPCHAVKVNFRDGLFTSKGETVLGGDDKAGIAILIEAIQYLQDNHQLFGPVEFLFTTCEEIGLLGAKAFNSTDLTAKMGYALDSTGVDVVITEAPAAQEFQATLIGLAAHAGLHPEQGISALQLAAQALVRLNLGRLDSLSTANVGLISGGTATNIIPDRVFLRGEVRSHSNKLLNQYVADIHNVFQDVVDCRPHVQGLTRVPGLEFDFFEQYPRMRLAADAPALHRIRCAAGSLSRKISFIRAGGGSDANILNQSGLNTAILGIGMTDVHSTHESIHLQDMARTVELVISLLTS